jgi:signal transduction histidine kinase
MLTVQRNPESTDPGNLLLSVMDTGNGIASDKIDLIFSSFSQVDSSTTRKYGGTGLGLAIVERLVRLMEGRIWVESAPGEGSKFSFNARFSVAPKVMQPGVSAPATLIGVRISWLSTTTETIDSSCVRC